MLRSKKRVIVAVSSLLFLTVLLYTVFVAYNQWRQISFFSLSLREAEVSEEVTIGTKTYDVTGGTVLFNNKKVRSTEVLLPLRLAYAKTLARRSPIFGLSGVNLKKLEQEMANIQAVAEVLADTQLTPESHERVLRSLYPAEFLDALTKAEKARRTFLLSGNIIDKIEYEKHISKVTDAARFDIIFFKQTVAQAVPDDEKYIFRDGVVTRDSIVIALDEMIEAFSQKEFEVKRRQACTGGTISACKENDLLIDLPHAKQTGSLPLSQTESVRSILADGSNNPTIYDAPIVVLTHSFCLDSLPAPYPFISYKYDIAENTSKSRIMYTGNIVFVESDITGEGGKFLKLFAERNLRYVKTPTTSFYACMHTGSDTGKVRSVYVISSFASQHPELAPSEAERLFHDPHVIYESDAYEYLDAALSALRKSSDYKLENELIDIAVSAANMTERLEDLFGDMAFLDERYVNLKKSGLIEVKFPERTLLLSRSGFFVLFLGQIIEKEYPIHLFEQEAGGVAPGYLQQQLLLYPDLIHTVPRTEIIKALREYSTVHDLI
jgi:hypothetical protein